MEVLRLIQWYLICYQYDLFWEGDGTVSLAGPP